MTLPRDREALVERVAEAMWDAREAILCADNRAVLIAWPSAQGGTAAENMRTLARAALAALRAARPDVAAVLDGEAVAVPKVATREMVAATGYESRDNEMRGLFFIMATASPYAPPPECAP